MTNKKKPTETEKEPGGSAAPPEIPQDAIESLARCLYPAIRAYFESEDGQREWKAWKGDK